MTHAYELERKRTFEGKHVQHAKHIVVYHRKTFKKNKIQVNKINANTQMESRKNESFFP